MEVIFYEFIIPMHFQQCQETILIHLSFLQAGPRRRKNHLELKLFLNASGIYSSTIKSYSVNINGASYYTSSSFTTDFLALILKY